MNSEYDCLISCMILGKKGVGKSSIICRMLDDDFREQQETIGMETSSLTSELPNGAILKLNILDTGGNESYKNIIVKYFDEIHVAVLVFSMNDITSLQQLTEWNDILKQHGITKESHILLVVGNKLDLLADANLNKAISKTVKFDNQSFHKSGSSQNDNNLSRRLKSRFTNEELAQNEAKEIASWNALEHHNMTEKGKAFASSIGAYYVEVSALSGQNIKSLYSVLPKLAGTFFDIKPRLIKNGKRKKGESSIAMLKQKYGNIDEQSCNCVIS